MKTRIRYFILLFVLSCCCCKKVIQINLNDAGPQLVIQGEVTDMPGPYQIYITKTVNFSATNNFPPVSGAMVIISDNKGINDSLTETAPGVYKTHTFWQGKPGNSYTVSVMNSGKSYTATSAMPQPVPLDSIDFQKNGSFSGKTTISVVPCFQDPPGIANYYQFAELINGIPLNKIYIMDDRLSDGKYIRQVLYDDSVHINTGDKVTLNMYCIDASVNHYLDEMLRISNGAQSVTPANPDTNFNNGALGFFSAHTIVSKQNIAN
jgi:Domain of unknown function (DUF4249)